MQILPTPALAQIVKHFLIIESDQSANVQHRMFADGNTGIVFNYGDPLVHVENDVLNILPNSFIYGQPETFQNIISTGKIGMLIVVFQPFGCSSLLRFPAIELKNRILDLENFYPIVTKIISDQIMGSIDVFNRIRIIENFLTSKLKIENTSLNLAGHAIQLIIQNNGNLSVTELTSFFNVSERHLQRSFAEHIGLSPKRYSGIIRIQHFLKLLRKNSPQKSLTDLAYECGFFDQAHLIREMKNISGITPSQYVSQTNLLAANFLQISSK
ncbi:helix-turn-helix transcriptional regulator [Dyadobacter sp. 3J3]|uniref:helix-turn-helix transcriptional regulator n=1 Tax=Dyadobacter sp. 3J3 TaxID=2606600 RepID=UPI0013587D65|nr:helix-turn-helix transcriptional regulator [Dyadobacter sp. 3J3]